MDKKELDLKQLELEMEATRLSCIREAMTVANYDRICNNEASAYDENDFVDISNDFYEMRTKFRRLREHYTDNVKETENESKEA
jgi:hypothetical protein